ncbi:hypothetical protein [Parapedobacter sp. 10938]|uniref:hypothetical protein n=1 Tax=Parapedobacter flavus TaxID=3110225 RepID=UPI002DB85F59|nr:hypothetical protein [Parapedobacter sp. 10938]MEC3881141.1 hypothetical protein [Parapedobacter sp. 10938]
MSVQHHWGLLATIFSAAALLAGSSCQGPTSSEKANTIQGDTIPQGATVQESTTSCYLHTHERDSVRLSINLVSDSVSGTLHFKNYQIDGSQGTVTGRFHGDTLLVVYDFHAEGSHNRTEEAFLKQGVDLIRGFGDREPDGNTYRFTDRGAIDFEAGQIFQPVSCD